MSGGVVMWLVWLSGWCDGLVGVVDGVGVVGVVGDM